MEGKIFLNLDEDINNKKRKQKNTYMDLFLERRDQAANFALKGDNKSSYKYNKPSNYNNEKQGILMNNGVKKENNNRYDESYNKIKNNLSIETKSMRNSTDEKLENGKNYNKNNITKEKNRKGYTNDLKMERIVTDDLFNKNKINSAFIKKNKKYIPDKNKYETNTDKIYDKKEYKYRKRSLKDKIHENKRSDNKLDYYEGEENHRFYDSSGINDYYYNYESYKVKKYYKTNNEGLKKSNEERSKNDVLNIDNNKLKSISPIKNEIKINYEVNNDDFKSIEKEIENQSLIHNDRFENKNLEKKILNSYSCKNKNLNLFDNDKNKKTKNLYLNKIVKELPNTKTVSIRHKSISKIKTEMNKIKNENIEIITDEKKVSNNNMNQFYNKNESKEKNITNLNKNKNAENTDIMFANKINMMNLNNNQKDFDIKINNNINDSRKNP